MKKSDFIEKLQTRIFLEKKQAMEVVNVFFGSIKESLDSGNDVTIRNFGRFRVRHRKARIGRNPRNGEALKIPAKRFVIFKPGKALEDIVNGRGWK